MNHNKVSVNIMGKTYQVVCPDDQVDDLKQAAHDLDQKLLDIHQQNPHRQQEQTAMMAALNISHELVIVKRQQQESIQTMQRRIQQLQTNIDDALNKQEELLG